MSRTYAEVMDEAEAKSGNQVQRLPGCDGISYVEMIHPKTCKHVKIQSEPMHVLRALVKGFALVTNTKTDVRCKLVWGIGNEILPDYVIAGTRKLVKQIDECTEYFVALKEQDERQGIHGEGQDVAVQQPRKNRKKRKLTGKGDTSK